MTLGIGFFFFVLVVFLVCWVRMVFLIVCVMRVVYAMVFPALFFVCRANGVPCDVCLFVCVCVCCCQPFCIFRFFFSSTLCFPFCVFQYQDTPLHRAASEGKTETVVALLKLGAQVDIKNKVRSEFHFFLFDVFGQCVLCMCSSCLYNVCMYFPSLLLCVCL